MSVQIKIDATLARRLIDMLEYDAACYDLTAKVSTRKTYRKSMAAKMVQRRKAIAILKDSLPKRAKESA